MRPAHEANVTNTARIIGAPDAADPPAAGVWTLAGDRLIIAEPGGPATILVPSEQVRLLVVDLPLANRAKRLAALPFAIEDQVAESLDSLHLALGAEVAPRRYLVGVVSHARMAAWTELAEAAGLGHAAIVPDALALPRPGEGEWAVDLAAGRAVVRAADGTGFALPEGLLTAAWTAADRPAVRRYGGPLPVEIAASEAATTAEALSVRLLDPALDLRQGLYARRSGGLPNGWRRLGWVLAIGAVAHIGIAAADTVMLRVIADRRAAETRAVAAIAAPGANFGADLAAGVADLLPSGTQAPPDPFLPLLGRLAAALAPLDGALPARSIGYQGNVLTLDLAPGDADLRARVDAALKSAGVGATLSNAQDGGLRITVTNA